MPDYNFTTYPEPKRLEPKRQNLNGREFGRLTVIGFAGMKPPGNAMWHCLCSCGNGITRSANTLLLNKVRSCGCLYKESRRTAPQTHGRSNTPEHNAYTRARNRCVNPNFSEYGSYGGRGIEFRFDSFDAFFAEIGERPDPSHSIDRINNDGHYEIGNVRWATRHEQSRNRQTTVALTAFGKTQCMEDWADEYHIPANSLHYRIRNKWCVECAVTLPPHTICPHKPIPLSAENT